MERRIVGLIAASTLLIGILLWSRKDAEKPLGRYYPTVDVRVACEAQKELWCGLALPDDAPHQQRWRCMTEYTPRCMGCLYSLEEGRRKGTLRGRLPDDGCRALQTWKQTHSAPR